MKFIIVDTGELVDTRLIKRTPAQKVNNLKYVLNVCFHKHYQADANGFYPVPEHEWEAMIEDVQEQIDLFERRSPTCLLVSHLPTVQSKYDYYRNAGVSYELIPYYISPKEE